ncbi:hypothetical protein FPE01S_04_01510 [Flavihumibacter petaseus NBRC 106054]|uniref:TonB-dependent receptor n=2 Tax=Flavihumibacter TaxID=1004301 RepID=A0A0E9N538_9BACT|nr:hypothetical protein FPE01S_04_01510 [Flavihumibacter petaseus NBRC 106054]
MIAVMLGLTVAQGAVANPGNDSRNEGVIHGYVVDAVTKKPVKGVVVSAVVGKTSVSKEVSTNADGYFRIKQLPNGEMSIKFDKKGYKFLRKESVKVKDGGVVKMNVDIYVESDEYLPSDLEHPTLRLIEGIL